jgi:chromosome condensin MukBEF ATPase and DNA-binding subunit MukB
LDQGDFNHLVRLALAQYGVEVDDVELRVIQVFDQVYGPHRDALVAADLSDVEPELGLDPSRAPH